MNSADKLQAYLEIVREVTGRDPATLRHHLAQVFGDVEMSGVRMLDIGGGDGVFSFYAAAMDAAEVVCVEPAGEGARTDAHERFRVMQRNLSYGGRVALEPRAVQEFAPDGPGFDVLLLHNSVNHLDEEACIRLGAGGEFRQRYAEIFDGLFRLTAPAGRLIVCDCSRYNFFRLLGIRSPFAPRISWRKHQSPVLWAELLSESGFRQPRTTWATGPRQGPLGRLLTGNAAGAFFFTSYFCLHMHKPAGVT
jgi:hypothetical protein